MLENVAPNGKTLPLQLSWLAVWCRTSSEVLHLGPPAITTGTGQLSTTVLKVSMSPVKFALIMSAPSSAPMRAACATTSGACSFCILAPVGTSLQ